LFKYLLLISIILQLLSCNKSISTRGHATIENDGDTLTLTTWSDGSISFIANDKRYTMLSNSSATISGSTVNLDSGILVYNKIFHYGSIVPQIIGNLQWGSLVLYRLETSMLPGSLTGKAVIDYNDSTPALSVDVHFLYKRSGKKYYGFYVPQSVKKENSQINISISLYKKDALIGSIKTNHAVEPKEWETQTIWFQKSKTTELSNNNWKRYYEENKPRTEIRNKVSPENLADSGFDWPLNDPDRITSEFGLRRVWIKYNGQRGKPGIHYGLDFGADQGTPIFAAGDGVVKYARNGALIGNTIIIDHGLGLFSDYSHCQSLAVEDGVSVRKGDLIGYVGMSGAATGPHLHWGAKVYNHTVDPRSLFTISAGF
jgi:murein DD-endopeptidase MepM/ murein hydrolase activator NlpD